MAEDVFEHLVESQRGSLITRVTTHKGMHHTMHLGALTSGLFDSNPIPAYPRKASQTASAALG